MAIDDNTSYELTGAQVKDLANKIKGKAADNTFVGATSAAPGSKGLVPEPQAGDGTKFLSGDGTWQTPPTVNNGALTIQQNGTTLDTFTANSSDDKTVNIRTITADTVAPAEEVGAITSSMIDWSTMPGSYSTSEQKTPFTWIDGKPIYKKTFVVSIPSSGNTVTFQHMINNLGFFVKSEGVAMGSNGTTARFLPDFYIDNDNISGVFGCAIYGGSLSSGSVDITYGSWYRGGKVYATLYYTKTTD